jgi:hypothetical protein
MESLRDLARSGKRLVHVSHSVKVVGAFDALGTRLVEAPADWFPRSIGVRVAGIPVRKRVMVEFGDAVKTSNWAAVRVNWKATFPQQLFPTMEGKVSLSPQGRETVKLTVSGVYRPPLGRLGEDINEAVMHPIAELTIKELAASIAKRLTKRVRT